MRATGATPLNNNKKNNADDLSYLDDLLGEDDKMDSSSSSESEDVEEHIKAGNPDERMSILNASFKFGQDFNKLGHVSAGMSNVPKHRNAATTNLQCILDKK
jgi:hypothetical protein